MSASETSFNHRCEGQSLLSNAINAEHIPIALTFFNTVVPHRINKNALA